MGRSQAPTLMMALSIASVAALNPIGPAAGFVGGLADPHVHMFESRYYVYATHDFAPNNTGEIFD